MLASFSVWFESLGWRTGLLFAFAIALMLCILVLLIDSAIVRFARWNELRQIRQRLWDTRKRRLQETLDAQREQQRRVDEDTEFLRRLELDVRRDSAQSNRETQQFHISAAFRDMKGLHR